jgi:hypothetical protein
MHAFLEKVCVPKTDSHIGTVVSMPSCRVWSTWNVLYKRFNITLLKSTFDFILVPGTQYTVKEYHEMYVVYYCFRDFLLL